MQDDHPYDMVDTETASLFHRHTHHTRFSTSQASTNTVKRGLHLIGGIPSSYTLFSTSLEEYKLGHIPRDTQDNRRHS